MHTTCPPLLSPLPSSPHPALLLSSPFAPSSCPSSPLPSPPLLQVIAMIKGLALLMQRMEKHFSQAIRRHIYVTVQEFVQVTIRDSIRLTTKKKKHQPKT